MLQTKKINMYLYKINHSNNGGQSNFILKIHLIFHSFLLSSIFGLLGYILIEYRFIDLYDGKLQGATVEIKSTGSKNPNSKNSEVWFYGIYKIFDNKKISWDQILVDKSWEKRGEIYISYKKQPGIVRFKYSEPIRLEFGAHPYSGLVNIKFLEKNEKLDLYSIKNESKAFIIEPESTFRNSSKYFFFLGIFISFGILLAFGSILYGWKGVYESIFSILLIFSLYYTLSVYFPGVYTNDSSSQLKQAITGVYFDWHPPIMAWIWSILIKFTGYIESLMIFNLAFLFVGAIYWWRIFEKLDIKSASLFLPFLIVSPVVINFSGVVLKDVGFAFSLFLATGMIGVSILENQISMCRIIAVFALTFYAFGVRENGILAIFPILLCTSSLIVIKHQVGNSKKANILISLGSSSLVLIIIVFIAQNISYKYLNAEKQYPIQYLELYDIAGISANSGIDYFPWFIKNDSIHDIKKITQEYKISLIIGNANNLLFITKNSLKSLIPLNGDANLQAQIRRSWFNAIFMSPNAYLTHRLSLVSNLMGRKLYASEQPQMNEDREKVLISNFVNQNETIFSNINFYYSTSARNAFLDSIAWAQKSYLYFGWFWLALLISQLFIGSIIVKRNKVGILILMISSSGLLYILPYAIIAPASDFRYLYWCCLSGTVLMILILSLIGRKFIETSIDFLIRKKYM